MEKWGNKVINKLLIFPNFLSKRIMKIELKFIIFIYFICPILEKWGNKVINKLLIFPNFLSKRIMKIELKFIYCNYNNFGIF